MNQKIASATLAALLALAVAGCATTGEGVESAKAAPPALSAEATQALAQAEADIQKAKAGYALWTVAEDAMKKAQEAAKTGDSDTVIKETKKVAKLTKLGLEQNSYPLTELK